MRHAPSMTGLRAFEAVVRHGTLSGAARELCVTPAAISHRLRELDATGGRALLHRRHGRFVPTETGRILVETLGDAFKRIRLADDILRDGGNQAFGITASYSFAVLWLMPRIDGFQEQVPEADLVVHPTHTPLAHVRREVTILHAARQPDEGHWALLFQDRCAAVARADHPLFHREGCSARDVLDCRLVHIAHENGPDWGEFSWQAWARALGLEWPGPRKGPSVSAEHLAVDILLSSDAFALVSVVAASRMLADGRLRAVAGSAVATGCSYWISAAAGPAKASSRAQAFGAWMSRELGR